MKPISSPQKAPLAAPTVQKFTIWFSLMAPSLSAVATDGICDIDQIFRGHAQQFLARGFGLIRRFVTNDDKFDISLTPSGYCLMVKVPNPHLRSRRILSNGTDCSKSLM